MRLPVGPVVLACVTAVGSTSSAAPANTLPSTEQLTLEQAIERAFAYAPQLAALDEQVEGARGRLVSAETYRYNPELRGEVGRRAGSDDTVLDYAASLGQVLEIGGQWGLREDVARAELRASEQSLLHAKRELAATVSLRFIEALAARSAVQVAEANLELARSLVDVSQRRLELGAGTQLDVNVAAAELVRAQRQRLSARSDYQATLVALAEVIGAELQPAPEPVGALPLAGLEPVPPLDVLLAGVAERREDLIALALERRAAASAVSLARREGVPNLALEGFVEREDGTDTIVGVGISVPIPLWNRNQGEVRVARARSRRVAAEAELRHRAARAQVVAAYEVYVAARESYTAMQEGVLGKLEQNLELLRKAFEAGKVGWTDVLVMRQSFIDAERELVDAAAETERARVRLELAAGTLPVPAGAREKRR